MVTYDWKILGIDNYPTLQDNNGNEFYDVIYAIQWQITGTDENYNTAWIYDRMGLDIILTDNFISRHEIPEEMLIEWAKSKLGVEKIAELEQQIAQMLIEASSNK